MTNEKETWNPDVALTSCSERRAGLESAEAAWLVTVDGRDGGMLIRDDREVWIARHPDATIEGGFPERETALAALVAPFEPEPEKEAT